MKHLSPKEAQALLAEKPLSLIDVREPQEWARGHLPNAKLVPLATVKLDPARALPAGGIVFVCAKGGRSQQAAQAAEAAGFTEVYSIDGGTDEWARLGLPIEAPPAPAPSPPVDGGVPADLDAPLPELDSVIANNLRELRSARQLSLDQAARLTGLSRTLLGQIELGTVTPSVGVVWRIARAFDVHFATLLADKRSTTTALLRKASAKRLISADGRFSSRALFPFGDSGKVEFYELWLAGHSREDAEAHQPGTRENLVVTRGKLVIEFGGATHELSEGDAIVFGADVAHSYRNPQSEECWMHLVMSYA